MNRWFVLLLLAASAPAADWPPTMDRANTTTRSLDGRTIERYTHGPRDVWGYSGTAPEEWAYAPAQESGKTGQNHNSFYLLAPKKPRKNAPLCVVLHSANRTAYDYLGYQALGRKIDGGDDPATVVTRALDDCYALFVSSTNAEWYGWSAVRREGAKYTGAPTPAERRIFDTIEWVVRRYKIDRGRIYLSGVSMGGCGSLALGLPHGDVFAAVAAFVPAGTEYLASRMGFPPALSAGASAAERESWIKQISGYGRLDPPVLVDMSAQNDNWSKTQPALLQAAAEGRMPLILGWGPFGHPTFGSRMAKYPHCDVALAFPWMEIRKDAAYPVFTNATSDQRAPWRNASTEFDESGQMNAWFRWKSERDQPSKIVMRLWIAHPAVKNPPPAMPEASTADVTLRRLQRFKVQPGRTYGWKLVRNGKPVASGKVTPDAANLLTIPKVTLTTTAAELSVSVDF
jgi:dienelactone hydrolase